MKDDLIAERDALAERLNHLQALLADPDTPRNDNRRLLAEQAEAMDHYLEVLEERIDRLPEDDDGVPNEASPPSEEEEPIDGVPEQNRAHEGEA